MWVYAIYIDSYLYTVYKAIASVNEEDRSLVNSKVNF